ncbi:MAG: dockerin type I domain-containing protein, partial [bacterium]|nr:dockerin type I domain-containing protein [bacterium]
GALDNKHWFMENNAGVLSFGTTTDALAVSGTRALTILNNGNVGIGTTTPSANLTVAGSFYLLGGSGDANGINGLDIGDAMFIQQYLAGTRQLSQSQYANADINGDGRVNRLDAELISKILSKIPSETITLDDAQYGLGKLKANQAVNYNYNGNVGLSVADPQARLDFGQLPASTEGIRIKIGASTPFSPLAIIDASGNDVFRVKEDGSVIATSSVYAGNLKIQSSIQNSIAQFINTDKGRGWGMFVNAGGSDADQKYYVALFRDGNNNDRFKILANGDVIVNKLALAGGGNRCVYVTDTGVLSAKSSDCGTASGSSQWTTAGSDIYYDSGNVGIGTTDPARKFHLAGLSYSAALNDSNALITSTDDPAADLGGSLGLGGKYKTADDPIAFATIYGRKENATAGDVSGYLAFALRDNSAAPYNFERLRITSSGNVGIGTTNPQGDLVVAGGGASYFQGGVNMGAVWNGSSFNFKQLADDSQNIIYGAANSGSNFGNLLKLERCSNGANPSCTSQFTVSNNGHLSIGASAPLSNFGLYMYLGDLKNNQSGNATIVKIGAQISADSDYASLEGMSLSPSFYNIDSHLGVNVYGLRIISSNGQGAVANAYAIYTDAPSIGANNWAIYSASGNNYFGGSVTLDSLKGTGGSRCVYVTDTGVLSAKDADCGSGGGAEVDGIIGNEVTDAANATLTRSGAGTAADPYKLALNLGNANNWTSTQTFSNANSVIISGTGTGLSFTQTGNAAAFIDSNKGVQLRIDTDDATDNVNDSANFIIVNGANNLVWSMDESGILQTGSIPWGRITDFAGDANASDDITSLSVTAPLSVSGTGNSRTVAISGTGCTNGQVLKWNGSSWACADDTDTNTIYGVLTNQGLRLSGINFGLTNACGNNQLLKWNGSSWACADDNTGAASGVRTKRIFVTSTSYTGSLGGLAGADAKCQARATVGGLTGTWKALMSDNTTNAKDRLGTAWDLLADILGMPLISRASIWDTTSGYNVLNFYFYTTELGTKSGASFGVWTGTDSSGNKTTFNCQNWSSNYYLNYSTTGRIGDLDYKWINNQSNAVCNANYYLYCFEQ